MSNISQILVTQLTIEVPVYKNEALLKKIYSIISIYFEL